YGALRLLDRADLEDDEGVARELDNRRRVTPEEDEDGRLVLERDLGGRPLVLVEDEIHAERAVGELAGPLDPQGEQLAHTGSPEDAAAARVRHRRGELGPGARAEADRE